MTVAIERDRLGQATAITRSGGGVSATRQYVYDAHRRLCKTIEPESGATVQAHDAVGNVAWRASGLALPSVTTCDEGAVPAARRITYAYDARNRLTSTTYGVGSYAFTYGHDAHGHPASLTYPDGVTVSHAPNALGQPTAAGAYATAVRHHPNGAIASFTRGNGVVHALSQNPRGLPATWADAGVIADQYTYDANGNVAAITDALQGIASRTMAYDGQNRLTAAASHGVWGSASYGYDALDNIRTSIVGGRSLTHAIDANNRLVGLSGSQAIGLAYDANGNVTQRGGQSYVFDIGNRLTAAPGKASFAYDGHGRRTRLAYADGSSRVQVYGPQGRLLWASHSVQGARKYVYLAQRLIAEVGAAGVDYAYTDALGSPVARSDGTRTRYEPYGATAAGTNPERVGFTGHVNDADTGLVYMQQRYYDPVAGRFLSVDPITTDTKTGGFFGRYNYANNNPYKFVDPDGRAPGDPYRFPLVPGGPSGGGSLGGGSRSGDRSGSGGGESGATITRYMGPGEARVVKESGSIPNVGIDGKPRPTHVTTDKPVKHALEAQTKYELPSTPTHAATVPASRVTDLGPTPDGRHITSGGGNQAATNQPIPVKRNELRELGN